MKWECTVSTAEWGAHKKETGHSLLKMWQLLGVSDLKWWWGVFFSSIQRLSFFLICVARIFFWKTIQVHQVFDVNIRLPNLGNSFSIFTAIEAKKIWKFKGSLEIIKSNIILQVGKQRSYTGRWPSQDQSLKNSSFPSPENFHRNLLPESHAFQSYPKSLMELRLRKALSVTKRTLLLWA